MTEPSADAAAMLAALDPLREQIEAAVAERDRLYEERAETFRAIREACPDLPLSQIAARAGVSVPAVIQQIAKAEARKAAAAESAAG